MIVDARCSESCRQPCREHLTKKQADVFKLWINEVGTTRISVMMGVAEPTARAHLRRALQKLKPYLEEAA